MVWSGYFSEGSIDNSLVDLVDIEFKGDSVLAVDNEGTGSKIYEYDTNNSFYRSQKLFSNDLYAYDLLIFNNRDFVSYDNNDINEYDSSWNVNVVDDSCSFTFKLISSDMDSDGRDDLVSTCGDSVKWYKNENNSTLTQKSTGIDFVNGSYPLDIVAVGENHKDLLVSVPNDDKVYRLKNDSSESFSKEVFLDDEATKLYQDKNTTFTIVPKQNRVLKIKDGRVITINSPNLIVTPNTVIENDLDGDGKKDLIVGTKDKLFVFYQQSEENNLIKF